MAETVERRERREAGTDRLRIAKAKGGGEYVYQGDKEEAPQKKAEEAHSSRCHKCGREIGFTVFVSVKSTVDGQTYLYHREPCAKEF